MKKLFIGLLILLISTTAFGADYVTNNYKLIVPEEGSRGWTAKISNDIVTIDEVMWMTSKDAGVISRDVQAISNTVVIISNDVGDFKSRITFDSATVWVDPDLDGANEYKITADAFVLQQGTTSNMISSAYGGEPLFITRRSASTVIGQNTATSNGDTLGTYRFEAVDSGSNVETVGEIREVQTKTGANLEGRIELRVAEEGTVTTILTVSRDSAFLGDNFITSTAGITSDAISTDVVYSDGLSIKTESAPVKTLGISYDSSEALPYWNLDSTSNEIRSRDNFTVVGKVTADTISVDSMTMSPDVNSPDVVAGVPRIYISQDPAGINYLVWYDGANWKLINAG